MTTGDAGFGRKRELAETRETAPTKFGRAPAAERELSDAFAGALREAIRLLTPKAPDSSPASGVVAESVALLISYHAARGAK